MNREDIIRIATESWLTEYGRTLLLRGFDIEINIEELERFAALVAAAEREEIIQMVEKEPALVEFAKNDKGGCLVCGFTPRLAAAAIRAKGNT